ncbi:MAG: septal ring lytic transglycosylase RlpA family protein [Chitinophagaceae bacterium]|nr:septal ring lytic transglycosylase RlpA family protein [Chitinophagaceae bacterium]
MKLLKSIPFILILLVIVTVVFSFTPVKQIAVNKWHGIASYYHPKFNGRKTSTGEIFSNSKLTAANNFLKLGTLVKVTNVKNQKSIIVKINDRMNKNNQRLIDLSQAAAAKLGLIHQGLGEVEMEVLSLEDQLIVQR